MTALRTLQTYARAAARPRRAAEERCELCAAPLAGAHRHLVDLEQRSLRCACQACALLFPSAAGAGSRYRAVPDRVRIDPSLTLTDEGWARLEIPVRLAFMFFNSRLRRWIALYPGPAGATEAELPQAWAELAAASPLIQGVAPDVEALLCWGPRGATAFDVYLAPIDLCYELVARLRRSWRGFDGGDDVREQLAGVFGGLRARSRRLTQAERERMP